MSQWLNPRHPLHQVKVRLLVDHFQLTQQKLEKSMFFILKPTSLEASPLCCHKGHRQLTNTTPR